MWIIFIAFALLSWIVSSSLERKIRKFSEVPVRFTGREIAERILRDNGIDDVVVTCIKGKLTDHYNPIDRTVNLSEGVYNSSNVAAVAVAAHECGHALQHREEYAPLQFRSALVPVVSFSNKWVMWVILAGLLVIDRFPQLLLFGIGLYGLTTLFTFVTLPVEIDASKRAITWLEIAGVTNSETTPMAKSALRSAAYTYVVAALASLATLIYYISIYTGSNRN